MGSAQPVEIVVTDAASGRGMENARVDFAVAHRHHSPSLNALTEDEYLDRCLYRRHITNVAGRACMVIDIGWVTGGLFADLDTKRDRLTGELYLLRINSAGTTEILTAMMTPGVTTRGKHFAVRVISVGKARPLTQEEFLADDWHGASWAGHRVSPDTSRRGDG